MPSSSTHGSLRGVLTFWDTAACGTQFADAPPLSREFFEEYTRFRYATEWHIPRYVPFSRFSGQKVLEIGCGNGADAVQFARHGAAYTGVDLTPEAVTATRAHLNWQGLHGDLMVCNAECLPFASDSFDLVYSHGVLHHTPNPPIAISEVYRVLKPGGRTIVMLYNRHSFNYYVRIMLVMRLRLLAMILRRCRHWDADRKQLRGDTFTSVRGNAGDDVLWAHYANFLESGWSYLSPNTFVHHATDGPACPYAYAYSRQEMPALFRSFSGIRTRLAHFPIGKYLGTTALSRRIERSLATRMGWYLFISARKEPEKE